MIVYGRVETLPTIHAGQSHLPIEPLGTEMRFFPEAMARVADVLRCCQLRNEQVRGFVVSPRTYASLVADSVLRAERRSPDQLRIHSPRELSVFGVPVWLAGETHVLFAGEGHERAERVTALVGGDSVERVAKDPRERNVWASDGTPWLPF